MRWFVAVLIIFGLIMSNEKATADEGVLYLEKVRPIDESYQHDRAEYDQFIKQLQHLLSVRAENKMRAKLLGVKVNIVNRGKAEVFTLKNTIYIDIALLDLLMRFSDELSVSSIKNDQLMHMEFSLAYAVALNGDKSLPYLDPYNTARLSPEQWQLLWQAKLRSQKVIFDNILAFMVAHEMSHLLLNHDQSIQTIFPSTESRNSSNPVWVRVRREMELAADKLASELCINANLQPAQLLPWLTLNEIRRRFYGKSAEYPTSAQRIAVINDTYNRIIGADKLKGDLRELSPLAPHRDVLQLDYHLYLEEFRTVRQYAQQFLIEIDRIINDSIKSGYPVNEVADYIVFYITAHQELLLGHQDEKVIAELLTLINSANKETELDKNRFEELLNQSKVTKNVNELFRQELAMQPIRVDVMQSYLEMLKAKPGQFELGLNFPYLLSNTYFRWIPEVFSELVNALPQSETRARSLKPFMLGKDIISDPLTYQEKLNILRIWDGSFPSIKEVEQFVDQR